MVRYNDGKMHINKDESCKLFVGVDDQVGPLLHLALRAAVVVCPYNVEHGLNTNFNTESSPNTYENHCHYSDAL
jgi:hypothetical protein